LKRGTADEVADKALLVRISEEHEQSVPYLLCRYPPM